MLFRIEVGLKPGFKDAFGESVSKRIKEDLKTPLEKVETVSVFTIDARISLHETENLAKKIFCDSIVQEYSINRPLCAGKKFDWIIEVGFRAGVTDNVGKTAKEAIEYSLNRKLGENEAVSTSAQYILSGKLSLQQAEKIAKNCLCNELIERFEIYSSKNFDFEKGILPKILKVNEAFEEKTEEIDLNVSKEKLQELSGKKLLALNAEEMLAIRKKFSEKKFIEERKKSGLGEKITDAELECLAQTWSEHCKHKIFNAEIDYCEEINGIKRKSKINSVFKTFIRGATEKIALKKKGFMVSVFKDNAGIISFNKGWNIAFKVETHNTPSALEPYGGALTGIVGVNRDILGCGIGAKPIFNTDVFCFATPFFKGKLPEKMLHPKRIFEGVRKGVEHGGNKSGIPTVNGSIVFDDRYRGKPLVYCGTAGIMPKKINGIKTEEKTINAGDLIVMAGGRIGKDGIHGATFSSTELNENSPVSAVQIGDPITQKKMLDCILEARDLGLINSITDNGAGGLSSSVGEMACFSNGCELNLEKAPLKYHGLQPWEILLSEAQERMTIAVSPEKISSFNELCKKHSVEATVLGKFTDSGKFHCLYNGKTIVLLEMDFLHEGIPKMKLKGEWKAGIKNEKVFSEPKNLENELIGLLGRLNVCSKEFVIRQYDHEVQGQSIIKPLMGKENDGPSDCGILKPLQDSFEGICVSNGITPKFSDIDSYDMAANALDEAIRNCIASGANPEKIAVLDNFCWPDSVFDKKGNPDGNFKLGQLVRANKGLYDNAIEFGTPFISGKDSMKNDYRIDGKKISIPPTVLVSAIAKIDDVRKAISIDFKKENDLIYLLGETFEELGGSEYFSQKGILGKNSPKVNAKKAKILYNAVHKAIENGIIASCHDVSDGGMGLAVAESSFAGDLGAKIDLRKVKYNGTPRNDFILFSETASRFIVSINPKNKSSFEKLLQGNVFSEIGKTTSSKKLKISGLNGKKIIDSNINGLKKAWKKTLDW